MSFSSIPVLADDGSAELHAATDEPGLAAVTWVACEGDGDTRATMLVDVRDLRAWCEAVLAMLRETEPVRPAESPRPLLEVVAAYLREQAGSGALRGACLRATPAEVAEVRHALEMMRASPRADHALRVLSPYEPPEERAR